MDLIWYFVNWECYLFFCRKDQKSFMSEKRTSLFYIVTCTVNSALFVGSLTQCQQAQGYLCVFLLHIFFSVSGNSATQIFCLQGKCHSQACCKFHALELFLCALMRVGPCWTASSAIHIQSISDVLTLRVFNFSLQFSINIEFRLQELPKGNKHPQFLFSGCFKSFW